MLCDIILLWDPGPAPIFPTENSYDNLEEETLGQPSRKESYE